MRIVRCTGSRVQIAPQPATTYKRLVFSYLESWICWGTQPFEFGIPLDGGGTGCLRLN